MKVATKKVIVDIMVIERALKFVTKLFLACTIITCFPSLEIFAFLDYLCYDLAPSAS